MTSMPMGLRLYRAATTLVGPLVGPLLYWRAMAGKEDAARLKERTAHTSAIRPRGTLVWLHGASVGETRVLMNVHDALRARRQDLSFLFTSGTRTSASLLANAPPRALHHFAPVDRPDVARRFMAQWRPDLAVFAEGEIWPNLIEEAARHGARLALVNARMSARSFASWGRSPAFARHVFNRFDVILAADARTADGIGALVGRRIAAPGNLKRAAPPPRCDPDQLAAVRAACGSRPLWLAASTHPGEDEIALAAHAQLRTSHPDALLIIAPRHPERGAAVAALAGQAPRRALGDGVGAGPVFIADTMGEMGLFYTLAPVALVGGSLLPTLRGHNPVEPAQLACAVLSGPHVDSFADVYADLLEAGAARTVRDAPAIAAAVRLLWTDPATHAAQVGAATEVIARSDGALETTIAALEALLPKVAHAAA
ncbi:MAG: 3-deoxy-D-manno-octulosonic acid transferase [Hyphomonadaceae bacterium]|nr:3-deoxy-D-manno-octulosonic acid transferase [Hyphomonadaceae bacterium]